MNIIYEKNKRKARTKKLVNTENTRKTDSDVHNTGNMLKNKLTRSE